MSYHLIDIGSAPNSKDGDTARSAFRKVNENFAIIFGSANAIIVNQHENFNAQSYTTYLVDTTNSAVTAMLPTVPNVGDVIRFVDVNGKFNTNSFFVNMNGKKYQGATTVTRTYSSQYAVVKLFYAGGAVGWIAE